MTNTLSTDLSKPHTLSESVSKGLDTHSTEKNARTLLSMLVMNSQEVYILNKFFYMLMLTTQENWDTLPPMRASFVTKWNI